VNESILAALLMIAFGVFLGWVFRGAIKSGRLTDEYRSVTSRNEAPLAFYLSMIILGATSVGSLALGLTMLVP
jgi:hypothetical protein